MHPGNNPDPSGIGEMNGDIGTILFLDNKGIHFSTPEEDRYHIFTPINRVYYPYDIYSTLELTPSIVYGK